jgi:tetraacyldisaccharide 4'-kinase
MIKLKYPNFWNKKGILSALLWPFSYIYKFLGFIRSKMNTPVKLPSFVICIGNMTIGGTGKTQFTKWLAKKLQENNHNFLIVTKGYGSKLKTAKLVENSDLAADVGDESKLLSEYGPVLASKSVKAAIPIIEKLKPEIIIFDDGMQNPYFIKDFTILVIDTIRAAGNNCIFPSGPLRQSVDSAINKADIITFVGSNLCTDFTLVQKISISDKPLFKCKITLATTIPKDQKYYAFAAIGDPDRFYRLLSENGIDIIIKKSFPDHHNYHDEEIKCLVDEANANNCQLITTAKDYVKINRKHNIKYVDVDLQFDNEKELLKIVNKKIQLRNYIPL